MPSFRDALTQNRSVLMPKKEPLSELMFNLLTTGGRMVTENILSRKTASITEFKKNPTAAMSESHAEPIAVLNHNKPAFYCVPPAMFELMFEHMSDALLLQKAVDRSGDDEIDVSWDDI